jgi:hypothetical protein
MKMDPVKVVVRYTNGEVAKGFTHDFFPNKDLFHLFPNENDSGESIEVRLQELKAVFMVQDFTGTPQYDPRNLFLDEEKPTGRKVEIRFRDGETLVGSILGYDSKRQGFFLFPADPKNNNMRVFVISSAVKKVRFLDLTATGRLKLRAGKAGPGI